MEFNLENKSLRLGICNDADTKRNQISVPNTDSLSNND